MPQFIVAVHHPDDFDGSTEGPEVIQDIDSLNEEMEAKGIRRFANGLFGAKEAKTLQAQPGGEVSVTDGPFLPGNIHMGGFWILECADMDEAVEWGKKAVKACRTPIEVRQFHG